MSIYRQIEVGSIKENYKKSKLYNYGKSKLKMNRVLKRIFKKILKNILIL